MKMVITSTFQVFSVLTNSYEKGMSILRSYVPFYERVIWLSQHLNNSLEVPQLVRVGARTWTQCWLIASVFSWLWDCACLWFLDFPFQGQSVQPGLPQHPHLLSPCTEGKQVVPQVFPGGPLLPCSSTENESSKCNLRSYPKPWATGTSSSTFQVMWSETSHKVKHSEWWQTQKRNRE